MKTTERNCGNMVVDTFSYFELCLVIPACQTTRCTGLSSQFYNQGVRHSRRKLPAKKTSMGLILFSGDPYGSRTRVSRMRTWCPNH